MNAYEQLVEDSDRLRDLIQRWRSTPENTEALLPEVTRELRATAAAKEQVLYPAVTRQDPARADLVAEAVRTNGQVEAFLAAARDIGPGGRGFFDQSHAAAAAADELLLHERRDLFPALRSDSLPETELAGLVERVRSARARYAVEDELAASRSGAGSLNAGH